MNHLLLGRGGTYSVKPESSKIGNHTCWGGVGLSMGRGEKQ